MDNSTQIKSAHKMIADWFPGPENAETRKSLREELRTQLDNGDPYLQVGRGMWFVSGGISDPQGRAFNECLNEIFGMKFPGLIHVPQSFSNF